MRSESRPDGKTARSFIDISRRAQIVDCAIEAIAEKGFAHASLAEIARRANVSKGVISYHFAGKSELIQELVKEVYTDAFTKIEYAMQAEPSATGKLRAYIRANLEFMKSNPRRMLAMVEVFMNFRTPDGRLFYDPTYNQPVIDHLEGIMLQGQAAGEFRPFLPRVMALALQSSLDAVLIELPSDPVLDLDAYTEALIDLFEAATRAVKPAHQ